MLPPLLLLIVAVGLLWLRPRPSLHKLAFGLTVVAVIGIVLAERGALPLPPAALGDSLEDWWTRTLAVVWWVIAARTAVNILGLVVGFDVRSRHARLLTDLASAAIWVTVTLVVLNAVLKLPISGLLATSGIVAVVIGLAMQSSLGDLFSGIAVGLDQPFRPGDRVSIADAAEGVVVQSNWRSIRILTDGEDIVTVPNSIVARSQIVNRSSGGERRLTTIQVTFPPTATVDRVIDLLGQAMMLCPDILEEPRPSVRLTWLGLRSNTYTASCFVADTPRMATARDQFLREARRLLHLANCDSILRTPSAQRLLAHLALFESLSEDQIDRLGRETTALALNAGDSLFEQGDQQTTLFLIASGVLEVSRSRDGDARPLVLKRIGAGRHIGEISLLTGEPSPATVTALTHVEAYELPREALERLIADAPDLAPKLERAVRRGLAIVHRDDGLHLDLDHEATHALVTRIWAFFAQHGRDHEGLRPADLDPIIHGPRAARVQAPTPVRSHG